MWKIKTYMFQFVNLVIDSKNSNGNEKSYLSMRNRIESTKTSSNDPIALSKYTRVA